VETLSAGPISPLTALTGMSLATESGVPLPESIVELLQQAGRGENKKKAKKAAKKEASKETAPVAV